MNCLKAFLLAFCLLFAVVAFRVMSNDYAVDLDAHSGQLELNAYEPLAELAVIESQSLLSRTALVFRTKCVDGITVNEKMLEHCMETTVGIVTAMNPIVGYEKATELTGEAYKSGKGILEVIRKKNSDRRANPATFGSSQADRVR